MRKTIISLNSKVMSLHLSVQDRGIDMTSSSAVSVTDDLLVRLRFVEDGCSDPVIASYALDTLHREDDWRGAEKMWKELDEYELKAQ
jgi:hypothetical protein